jgi:diaminohydroxyphosphoribosylaminopyrimidine deaminase / 5-amino-6-(5-phosphoribosylamino)uracil reductase
MSHHHRIQNMSNLPATADRQTDAAFLARCLSLARLGAGTVSPNPMVGSVLVHHDRIIGEGYHRRYGDPHAERNVIASVRKADIPQITHSTLYVSLEPCCHHGKTPPCTELIIDSGIRRVVVGIPDPNPLIHGKGIAILRQHGIEVVTGILEQESRYIIRYFHTWMHHKRPHVILKIVQSDDGYIGKTGEQIWLSNVYERVMVHQLRSEVDAILVGTNTAVIDNPELTTRHYPGRNPVRVILDRSRRIPHTHHIFDGAAPTLFFSEDPHDLPGHVTAVPWKFDAEFPVALLDDLYARRIQSLLVEGGTQIINSFLHAGIWDEALIVRTPHHLGAGVRAPLIEGRLVDKYRMMEDEVFVMRYE